MSCLAKGRSQGEKAPSRGNARGIAARLVWQMAQGRSLSDLFASEMQNVRERDRAFVKEICFGVARRWPTLEALLGQLLERPIKTKDGEVKALVMVGLYQLMQMRVPPHAAVKETVDAARPLKRRRPWAPGLVNGVLRRFQREQDELLQDIDDNPVARHALPAWLLGRLQKNWPDHWQSIAEVFRSHPPLSLRVNRSRLTREAYFDKLVQASITARPIPGVETGVVLDRPCDVESLPGFLQGEVSVQDGGAQLAAELLDLQPGQQVLDACAAPGGKSCYILEMVPDSLQLTAIDVDETRLERINENLERLGLQATVCQGDAAHPEGAWSEAGYDRILLDVPCSATGVIRRHPDIKLLRRDEDIDGLVKLQGEILDAIWPLLKPGGMLLYATCSLLAEENEQQVSRFMDLQQDARERPIMTEWGHPRTVGRQTLPGEGTMDGFYYARLEKTE
ncbi:16S rRNA (cytosine(967)-C(5))-methyltransferase RsmB [Solemya velesiana gill symbiont]|uniref:16S rRNA (cytosine(967)-C(5))-methyltransferase RsmB n=1 Tax=Solemya velesiana gill symbiont TaxID=1918948 RepID=UPI003CCBABD1